jgi:uncharacterized spore protein YtfJ
MKLEDVLGLASDAVTARRVYAEPVERDGVTVIAAAAVSGGGGAGGGVDQVGKEGSGGGFGLAARPVGSYVIKDGQVSWRPALDVNRLITVIGAVTVAAILVRGRTAKKSC